MFHVRRRVELQLLEQRKGAYTAAERCVNDDIGVALRAVLLILMPKLPVRFFSNSAGREEIS